MTLKGAEKSCFHDFASPCRTLILAVEWSLPFLCTWHEGLPWTGGCVGRPPLPSSTGRTSRGLFLSQPGPVKEEGLGWGGGQLLVILFPGR